MKAKIRPTPDEPLATPLAIIGLSGLFPKADGLEAYWANIRRGVDAITGIPPTHWRPEDYYDRDPKAPDRTYGRWGGFLPPLDFDPLAFGISPNNLDATDTAQLLSLWAADQAMRDAGYGPKRSFDRNRVSVIMGVTGTLELVIPLGARLGHPIWRRALAEAGVAPEAAQQVVERIAESYVPWQENSFPGLLGNVVAGRIANRLNLGGTNCTVDAACASSLGAVHLAGLELAAHRSDLAVTGGVDTFNSIFMYMCFSKTPALSPSGHARPFDRNGDGTTLGEGVGVLVLKRLADARRDGDRIYAVLKGIGSSSDGKGNAIYAPKAAGQQKALRSAYRMAGVEPDSIELIEAHGTGTKVGDAAEVSALTEVFRDARPEGTWCALGSVKSQIGHTKAAAGAAGLIKAALALHHKVLPPTIKVAAPLEALAGGRSPFYLNTQARPWAPRPGHPRRAGVSSFGFGGSNFHCVLEEASAEKPAADWDGSVQILAFAAEDARALRERLEPFAAPLDWQALRARAARSRAAFDPALPCRIALVAEREKNALPQQIGSIQKHLDERPEASFWTLPGGAAFGRGASLGKLAVLFSGQGAQYVGMFREWACRFPAFQKALFEAERAFQPKEDQDARLLDFLYPPPAFSEAERAAHEEHLRATEVAQPALGAVNLGAWRVLEAFGPRPDFLAGHSYGELLALCVSGRIEAAALHELSNARGELMARAGRKGREAGTMLAVQAPLARVEALLREAKLDHVVVANRNAPEQQVLSGPCGEIERAAAALARQGLKSKRLPVSAAFHSPLVASAGRPFAKALKRFAFADGAKCPVPVYANTTARPYPDAAGAARALLARQLSEPVEFAQTIEHLYAAGARAFVEVGPGARLSGLVRATLGERPHVASSVDAASGHGAGLSGLARTLANLAALGHPLNLTHWDEPGAALPEPTDKDSKRFTVSICGANYMKPRKKRLTPEPEPLAAPAPPLPPPRVRPAADASVNVREKEKTETPPLLSTDRPPAADAHPAPAPSAISEALRAAQANMAALQGIQEQTANLHRQFLEGQQAAVQTLQMLIDQQQRLLLGTPAAPAVSPVPVKTPGISAHAGTASPAVPPPVPAPAGAPSAEASPTAPVAPFPETSTSPEKPMDTKTPSAAPPVAGPRFEKLLLETVSAATGYPEEMLELDMELDADLGIDSIKRVEIFSMLQEKLPEMPAVESGQLGALRTLREIVRLLRERMEGKAESPRASQGAPSETERGHEPPPASPPSTLPAPRVEAVLLEVVAEKTGYPVEMLSAEMELEADLGIDSIKRVEILSALQERFPEASSVASDQLGALRTIAQIVQLLASDAKPESSAKEDQDAEAPAPLSRASRASESCPPPASESSESLERLVLRAKPLTDEETPGPEWSLPEGALVWITGEGSPLSASLEKEMRARGLRAQRVRVDGAQAPEPPERLGGLIILAPPSGSGDRFLKDAFRLLQRAAPALRRAGRDGGAVLATVSRLDGGFGLRGNGELALPESGGLAGLAKTARHEWPEVHARALDLSADFESPEAAASRIASEIFRQAPVEVGLSREQRWRLELQAVPLNGHAASEPLNGDGVVVVTGGARGITAEVSVALARAFRPTLLLLGRSPAPEPEAPWLAALETEVEIKRALLARGKERAPASAPKALDAAYRRVAANRELLRNLRRMEAAGANIFYRPVDVRDAVAVKAAVQEICAQAGPVQGLIHGAGVLADRLIEEKTAEQFDAVYDTKVAGLRSVLGAIDACGADELRLLVLFSSSTGRYGRRGQVAYAVSNEVLNKLAQQQARLRKNCRVLSINWGPWDGGMVTAGLRGIFEREGVGLIERHLGAEYLVHEIRANGESPVEIVVLGARKEPSEKTPAPRDTAARKTRKGVSGKPAPAPKAGLRPALPLAFALRMNLEDFPFLKDHVLDGRPVLPMALIAEWLAQGALHGHPGRSFHGFQSLRLLKGVVLEREALLPLRFLAGKAAAASDGLFRVPVELWSRDELAAGGREELHARGEVLLAADASSIAPPAARYNDLPRPPYAHAVEDVYREGLFHGPALQCIQTIEGCSEEGMTARVRCAPAPEAWVRQPLRHRWLTDPLALDGAFQLMILWCQEWCGAGSLPCAIGRYRQYKKSFPPDEVRIAIRVKSHHGRRACADMEFLDGGGRVVARLQDYECVLDAALKKAFRRNLVAP